MNAYGLLWSLVFLSVSMAFIIWRAKHQLTIFVVHAKSGRIVSIKGRLPRRLLGDIADAIRHEGPGELRIRCQVEDGAARVLVYGDTNAGFEQMLRNLVGEYPLPRLRQAPRVRRD